MKTDFNIGYEHKFVRQQYLDNSGRNSDSNTFFQLWKFLYFGGWFQMV